MRFNILKFLVFSAFLMVAFSGFTQNFIPPPLIPVPNEEKCYITEVKDALFQTLDKVIVERVGYVEYKLIPAKVDVINIEVVIKPAHHRLEYKQGKPCLILYPATIKTIQQTVITQAANVIETFHPPVFQYYKEEILVRDAYIETVRTDCK